MAAGRREPAAGVRSLRQWPLLVVVAGVVAGLAVAALGAHTWRVGCVVIGASLVAGALGRVLLPRRDAGLMQVRSQSFDVAVLALGGSAIIALALWVHGS